MRRILSLAVAVLMLLSVFAVSASAEDVEITLFHNKVEIAPYLQEFAAVYSERTDGVNVTIETYGGGADYSGSLTAKLTAGQLPAMFVIEGDGDYKLWKEYAADLSSEAWVANTDLAYKDPDGSVRGFPVSIEGFGLGYNAEILEKAGIDPATLTTFTALSEAFAKIDGMKDELGLTCVVSMGTSVSGGLWWVTGNHNFSVYLGGGLAYDNSTIIDKFNAGEVDETRLTAYANYVKLLFDYADYTVLTTGTYDDQLAAFAEGKCAFIHQGNWIDPSLKELGVTFDYSYISHPFDDSQEYTGLYLFAPSYYVVNASASEAEQQAAKDFLNYMVTSEEGADYMVNKAGMVPAFSNVTLEPAGGFSRALLAANAKGGNYAVRFGQMPAGTGQDILSPLFDLFAQDTSGEALNYFVQDVAAAAATVAAK